MQAAGDLVSPAAELAACVQHSQTDLHRGTAQLGMDARGDAAAVIGDADGVVLFDGHADGIADACHRFVNGVVHNFVDQVVQAALVGRADVHTGAAAHSLQTLEDLYVVCIIVIDLFCHEKVHLVMQCGFAHADKASGKKWAKNRA